MNRLLILVVFALIMVGAGQSTYADPIVYIANLSGPAESPTNNSPGTGSTIVTYDSVAHTLRVQVAFSGLLGNTTASHIHAATASPGTGTAGVATQTPTFTGFPLGVTSGTYDHTFDLTMLSSYNSAFVTANGGTAASAEAALTASMAAGTSYLNIHSNLFPGGEIRGFLRPVPEPATLLLLGTGLAGMIARLRKRRRAGKTEEA